MRKGLLVGVLIAAVFGLSSQTVVATTEGELAKEIDQFNKKVKRLERKVRSNRSAIKNNRKDLVDFKDRFSFNGFITAGLSQGSDENVKIDDGTGATSNFITGSRFSASSESVIGLQMDFSMSEHWRSTVQMTSSLGFDNTIYDAWAFLTYTPTDDLTIRFGRLRTPWYLYSEYLEVGFAYPRVRPPLEVYQIPFPNYEGFDIAYSFEIFGISALAKILYAGRNFNQIDEFQATVNRPRGGYLTLNKGPVTFKMGFTDGIVEPKFVGDYKAFNEVLGALGVTRLAEPGAYVAFPAMSLGYDDGQFLIQAEVSKLIWNRQLLNEYTGYSITSGYRMGKYIPFIGYATYKTSDNSRANRDEVESTLNSVADGLDGLKNGLDMVNTLVSTTGQINTAGKDNVAQVVTQLQPELVNTLTILSQMKNLPQFQAAFADLTIDIPQIESLLTNVVDNMAATDAEYNLALSSAISELNTLSTDTMAGVTNLAYYADPTIGAQLEAFNLVLMPAMNGGADHVMLASTLNDVSNAFLENSITLRGAAQLISSFNTQQSTISVGLRYDLNQKVSAKFQVDQTSHLNGTIGLYDVEDGYQIPDKLYNYTLIFDAVF